MNATNLYLNQFNTATDQNLLPLSAGLLAAAAKAQGPIGEHYRIFIRARREHPRAIAESYVSPAVLGFSCYSWNFRHSMEVARLAKLKHPACHVVLGGPEIPRAPDLIREFFGAWPFIDSIALAEGELVFSELVLTLLSHGDLSQVAGLAFVRPDGRVEINAPRPRIDSFANLPSPYLDGTFDEFIAQDGHDVTGALIETNRGCPFSCTFCDWGQSTKSKVRDMDLARIRAEMEWIGRQRMFLLWATDANFGLRAQDLQVAEAIASVRLRYGFPRILSVSWAKNCPERVRLIYDILARAGVDCQVTLTMQSMNPATLLAVRRSNISLGAFKTLKNAFGQMNTPTYSEYIFPLPEETYASFIDGLIQSLTRNWRDFFTVYMCRLIPNTELASPAHRRKFALQTRCCEIKIARRMTHPDSVPEFEELVVSTSTMPESDWAKTFRVSFLLSTLYNHRLADVVLNVLQDYFSVHLRSFLEFVVDDDEYPGPVLQRMRQNLRQHIASILSSQTPMMQVPEYGEYYWEPNESTYLIACLDTHAFFMDLHRVTVAYLQSRGQSPVAVELLDDLFAFQEQLVPDCTKSYPCAKVFRQDWLDIASRSDASLADDPGIEYAYQFDLQQSDQELALNDQCPAGESPPSALVAQRQFAMAQIKVTSVGKNAVCKVERLSSLAGRNRAEVPIMLAERYA